MSSTDDGKDLIPRTYFIGTSPGVFQHGSAADDIYILLGKRYATHLANETLKPPAVSGSENNCAADRLVGSIDHLFDPFFINSFFRKLWFGDIKTM
jgi:hypothetical protein